MSDADGDSQMHSTPSHSDDEMYPENDTPATPTNGRNNFAHAQVSELSPPNSTSPNAIGARSADGAAILHPAVQSPLHRSDVKRVGLASSTRLDGGVVVGEFPGSQAESEVANQTQSDYAGERLEDQPGYAWRNRKAHEEYLRAMDNIINKESMIGRKYGDPILDHLGRSYK